MHPRNGKSGILLQNTNPSKIRPRSENSGLFVTKYEGNASKIRPRSENLWLFVTKYKGNPIRNPEAE